MRILLRKYLSIILFIPCLYILVSLALARSQYEVALRGIKYGVYDGGEYYLNSGKNSLPLNIGFFLCQGDLQRIHTGLGKIWYETGLTARVNYVDRYAYMMQAYDDYSRAISINPIDHLAVQGIAETVAELEFLYVRLFPGRNNPHNGLPFFERLAQLEPNGFGSNKAHTAYLYRKGMEGRLLLQVQHMAKIYPSYSQLIRASFYSSETREAMMEGAREAVSAGVMVRNASFALSKFYQNEEAYAEAASWYKKALEKRADRVTDKELLKLGSLCLQAGNLNGAKEAFTASLKISRSPDQVLDMIFTWYRKQEKLEDFVAFAQEVEALRFITKERAKLSVARAKTQQKKYVQAHNILEAIIEHRPNHEALYLLAQVAAKERDWDAMELYSQRATVLEPKNGSYFYTLAQALMKQRKYKSAVDYMEKAVANDPENAAYIKKLNKAKSLIN